MNAARKGFFRRHPLVAFLLRRLGLAIPLLFIVSILTFVVVSLIPGDPADHILGGTGTPAAYAKLHAQLGLDQPLMVQYWNWLRNVFRGDLGESIFTHQSVMHQIGQRIGVTLTLVVGAAVVAAVAGVALGTFAARYKGAARWVVDVLTWAGFAIPAFWLGYLLVTAFAVELNWFPASGAPPLSTDPWKWFLSYVLPIVTLSVHGATSVAKQTRDAMDHALASEYITSLRADGIPERLVVFKHALRNAALPILTMIGLIFVGLLSGTVLVEQVFTLPGLGSLVVSAAGDHDLPVIEGVVLFFALIVVVVNLLVDVIYGWLDPRVRVR